MATDKSTVNFLLDQIGHAGTVSARKMFGEYALYCNGKVVGLVCNDTLFLKITQPGKVFVGDSYHEGFAYKGARASMQIDSDRVEDSEWISELVRITAENIPFPKSKK